MVAAVAFLSSLTPSAPVSGRSLDLLVNRGAWVCEQLGYKPDGQQVSIKGDRLYRSIQFSVGKGNRKGNCVVGLDVDQGRVSDFRYLLNTKAGQPSKSVSRNDKRAQAILAKLGYSGWLVPGKDGSFVGAIQGFPIFSAFPYSRAFLMYRGDQLVELYASVTMVAPPQSQIRVTQLQAVDAAKAKGARRLKRFAEGYSVLAQKGVIVELGAMRAKWAWKVEFSGRGRDWQAQKDTFYIDGATGSSFIPPMAVSQGGTMQSKGRLSRWNVPPAPEFRCARLEKVKEKLRKYSPLSRELISFYALDTCRVTAKDGADMALGRDFGLCMFRAGTQGPVRFLDDGAKSIALAKQLVSAESMRVPQGRYEWAADPTDLKPSVRFVQTAFGMDYLEPTPLTVRFGLNGELAKFDRLPSLPIPKTKPKKTLSRSQIEAAVAAWSRSRRTAETSRLWGKERVEVLRLGWVTDNALKHVDLAWEVRLTSQSAADSAGKKVKSFLSFFSAESGRFLRTPSARLSMARLAGDTYFSQEN